MSLRKLFSELSCPLLFVLRIQAYIYNWGQRGDGRRGDGFQISSVIAERLHVRKRTVVVVVSLYLQRTPPKYFVPITALEYETQSLEANISTLPAISRMFLQPAAFEAGRSSTSIVRTCYP